MSREAFPSLIKFLKDKPNGSAFVSINFRSKVDKCEAAIEAMLIEEKMDLDLVTIHGNMEKDEKFGSIKLFTGALRIYDYGPCC